MSNWVPAAAGVVACDGPTSHPGGVIHLAAYIRSDEGLQEVGTGKNMYQDQVDFKIHKTSLGQPWETQHGLDDIGTCFYECTNKLVNG